MSAILNSFGFGFENGTAAALGTFDGVHAGHLKVLETAVKLSGKTDTVALTFETPPKGAMRICDSAKKEQLIMSTGINQVISLDFNCIKNMLPEEFFSEILIGAFNSKLLVCGFNFRFGKNAAGDVNLLKKLCESCGVSLEVCKEVKLHGQTVCSSKIRENISKGNISEASEMLSRDYSVSGVVQKGKSLGHRMGFATANFTPENGLILPKLGVYAGYFKYGEVFFPTVINIGSQPTFSGDKIICEPHIIGFDGDLYDRKIEIFLLSYLRDIKNFGSPEILEKQVFADIEKTKEIFCKEAYRLK